MNEETINYRLTNIEQTLTELKDVIVEMELQRHEIKDIKDDVNNVVKSVEEHEKRLDTLEVAPYKEKSNKWQLIVDTVFKMIVSAFITFILIKMGVK